MHGLTSLAAVPFIWLARMPWHIGPFWEGRLSSSFQRDFPGLHWAQLSGTESVRDYVRQCVYDSVAEWQARAKASTIDGDTVKLLKDHLLRVPLQMESHADAAQPAAPAGAASATSVH